MAGVKMWADPQLDTPPYFQGWGPEVEWTDYGQVDAMDQETCVAYDCFDGVLVIAESSLGEVDAYQLKYYAMGVGNIQVGFRGEDATQEELELTEVVMDLEDHYGIQIDLNAAEAWDSLKTVGDVVDTIEKLIDSGS